MPARQVYPGVPQSVVFYGKLNRSRLADVKAVVVGVGIGGGFGRGIQDVVVQFHRATEIGFFPFRQVFVAYAEHARPFVRPVGRSGGIAHQRQFTIPAEPSCQTQGAPVAGGQVVPLVAGVVFRVFIPFCQGHRRIANDNPGRVLGGEAYLNVVGNRWIAVGAVQFVRERIVDVELRPVRHADAAGAKRSFACRKDAALQNLRASGERIAGSQRQHSLPLLAQIARSIRLPIRNAAAAFRHCMEPVAQTVIRRLVHRDRHAGNTHRALNANVKAVDVLSGQILHAEADFPVSIPEGQAALPRAAAGRTVCPYISFRGAGGIPLPDVIGEFVRIEKGSCQ